MEHFSKFDTSTFFQIRSKQFHRSFLALAQSQRPSIPYMTFFSGGRVLGLIPVTIFSLFLDRIVLLGCAMRGVICRHRFVSQVTKGGINLSEEPNNFIEMSFRDRCVLPFPLKGNSPEQKSIRDKNVNQNIDSNKMKALSNASECERSAQSYARIYVTYNQTIFTFR